MAQQWRLSSGPETYFVYIFYYTEIFFCVVKMSLDQMRDANAVLNFVARSANNTVHSGRVILVGGDNSALFRQIEMIETLVFSYSC